MDSERSDGGREVSVGLKLPTGKQLLAFHVRDLVPLDEHPLARKIEEHSKLEMRPRPEEHQKLLDAIRGN